MIIRIDTNEKDPYYLADTFSAFWFYKLPAEQINHKGSTGNSHRFLEAGWHGFNSSQDD
jgi:hypothetical protein